MPTADPQVSVVMSVCDGRPYLSQALQSILGQTFEDFEFIIINDGSTDGTREVLEQFANQDDRIRLFHQENRGLAASLNRGLDEARCPYIARMDADDVCLPERLERQVRFLEVNREVGIVGTQHVWIGEDGGVTNRPSLPTDPSFIAWRLLFKTCIVHPSIMARRSLMEKLGGYAEWAEYGQDYELWSRAVLDSRLANLPQVLIRYRRCGTKPTEEKRKAQWQTVCRSMATLHRAVLGASADEEISHFLARMHLSDLEHAVRRTGFTDFELAFEYIRLLYNACRRQFLEKRTDIQVRRAALPKLDAIAEKMAEEKGWLTGIEYKLRARLMPPAYEAIPWAWKVVQKRMHRREEAGRGAVHGNTDTYE